MTRREQNQLLNELLSGAELSDFRRTSLERGITAVRHERARRKVVRGAALVSLWLLLAAAMFSRYSSRPVVSHRSDAKAQSTVAQAQSTPDSQMEIISDEELFSLFPGRAMALIGRPGEQQLVFLDRPSSSFRQ